MEKTDIVRTVKGHLREEHLLPAAPPTRRIESRRDKESRGRPTSGEILRRAVES